MKFCATRQQGRTAYAVEFDADSLDEAQVMCRKNGWTLDGVLMMKIPARYGFFVKAWVWLANLFR